MLTGSSLMHVKLLGISRVVFCRRQRNQSLPMDLGQGIWWSK